MIPLLQNIGIAVRCGFGIRVWDFHVAPESFAVEASHEWPNP